MLNRNEKKSNQERSMNGKVELNNPNDIGYSQRNDKGDNAPKEFGEKPCKHRQTQRIASMLARKVADG